MDRRVETAKQRNSPGETACAPAPAPASAPVCAHPPQLTHHSPQPIAHTIKESGLVVWCFGTSPNSILLFFYSSFKRKKQKQNTPPHPPKKTRLHSSKKKQLYPRPHSRLCWSSSAQKSKFKYLINCVLFGFYFHMLILLLIDQLYFGRSPFKYSAGIFPEIAASSRSLQPSPSALPPTRTQTSPNQCFQRHKSHRHQSFECRAILTRIPFHKLSYIMAPSYAKTMKSTRCENAAAMRKARTQTTHREKERHTEGAR